MSLVLFRVSMSPAVRVAQRNPTWRDPRVSASPGLKSTGAHNSKALGLSQPKRLAHG
jgi:hypothetical protein